jgi:putative hydroxymethylpyrimidine transporter CytX
MSAPPGTAPTGTHSTGPSATEAPATLLEAPPRTLGLLDQLGFWGNLGVSLLGFAAAASILAPAGATPLSLPAAITALVVGSLLGGAMLGLSLVLGARAGAPAMVLLRGLLGAKASFLPTVLNIAQCLGWAVFELVVIADGLRALVHLPRWSCVLLAGLVTTLLTLRPLGAIRVLRKYVSVLVVAATVVLLAGLLRRPAVAPEGSWSGFWLAVDAAVALAISWVPLGADYSRHSRTGRSAFLGGAAGFGVTQVLCLLIGVLALVRIDQDPSRISDLFLSLPLGVAAFAVLVLRETDQSFANVYSTAVSIQNMAPRLDRRVLTVGISGVAVLGALTLDVAQYQNFLYLIGGVFIPLSGVLIGCWLRLGTGRWDTSTSAPLRPAMLLAWAAGFVGYQLINPGDIPAWSGFWTDAGTRLHTLGHPWLSASLASFAVALLLAVLTARPPRSAAG